MQRLLAATPLIFILACSGPSNDFGFTADVDRAESGSGGNTAADNPADSETLLDRRSGFTTKLSKQLRDTDSFPEPPPELFSIVQFDTGLGPMNAMLSKPQNAEQKHAAIIWITGGFPASGIGESAWEPSDPSNDQSAKIYRERGLIMMYPALRGCCNNPGHQEGFYGEVDDIISAGKYLQSLEHVDKDRIFLGGHSTGGTLVLLVAESTNMFRGVIAFGPVEDPFFYGMDCVNHGLFDAQERKLRAPINHLALIRSPTIVIEGSGGNLQSLVALRERSGGENPKLSFVEVKGVDHFEVLSPANRVLAEKIASLKPGQDLRLTTAEVAGQ